MLFFVCEALAGILRGVGRIKNRLAGNHQQQKVP
jgi:hypothetical protein